MSCEGTAIVTGHEIRGGRGVRTTALVLLVLVSGCSSTTTEASAGPTDVAPDERQVADLAPTASPDAPEPIPSSDLSDPAATRAAPRSDEPGATPEPPPATSGLAPARPAGTCLVPVQPGTPGITPKRIAIGVPHFQNVDSITSDPPEHDWHEFVEALVDHINATGGVACRELRVVWHDVDAADIATHGPAKEQAMCATWTQDHQVFVAIPGGSDFPYHVLFPCLDQAGVGVIDVRGLSYRDAEAFDDLPLLVNVNGTRLDRGAGAQVHALVRTDFLGPGSRIGVVHYDDPSMTRTVDGTLIPALESYGLSPVETAAITTPGGAADFPAREQEVATAALRFKLAEIDRVLVVRSAGLTSNFMNTAERNHYRPRYGLTTVELRVAAFEDAFAVPEAQLIGSVGSGWLVDSDLYPRRPDQWPARSLCLEFFDRRGFATTTDLDHLFAISACEALWFLRAAVEAAPGPLSRDSLVVGAAALGTSYESPTVRWTEFGPDRRDGAATYRDATYDTDCGCFTYVSEPRPLP